VTSLTSPSAVVAPWKCNEFALVALGLGTSLALFAASGSPNLVLLEVMGATTLYGLAISASRGSRGEQRIRLLASYAFVVWFYCAVARITPALGTTLRDGALLAMDEAMFGQTPAVFLERMATRGLTDIFSLCYMMYHVYLPVAVVHAALMSNLASHRLSVYLFTGFAVGFAGYLLVPAIGPVRAYPELFPGPLPGGTLAQLNEALSTKASSGFDVFPSLHVLITCILLDHDWREVRRRFWLMLVPAVGLLASTVYLQYHYGVDLIAGFLLFLALRQTFLKAKAEKVTLAP
jgi:hypothetical protein